MSLYSPGRIVRAARWLFSKDPAKRRRVHHELARVSASLFGDFPLSDDHKLWRQDKIFLRDFARLSPGNPYSADRKFTLREFARLTSSIDGDIAECGCYQGASAYFMAKECPNTRLHLFDSFEGLSVPTQSDTPPTDAQLPWSQGDLSCSEEHTRRVLQDFHHVHYYRGWIPAKFNEVEKHTFRLVHIDVDLYQPTLDSLAFFYPRLHQGGVIVLDDYGFTTCPGAHSATTEFMNDKPEHVIHLPTGQGVLIKQ